MNDRQLLQQALDALDQLYLPGELHRVNAVILALNERLAHCDRCGKRLGGEGDTCTPDPIGDAQDKLIAELAAQPEQEPVAIDWDTKTDTPIMGYTTPPAAPVAWNWHQAPVKTSWGRDMVVADLAIDKDHTVSVYCEHDQIAKVEAMFTTPPAAQPAPVQPEQEPVAWLGFNPRTGEPEFACDKPAPSVMRDYNMRPLVYTNTAPPAAAQRKPLTDEDELSNGLAMALHDAVLIRIGKDDEATRQAIARIDKLVAKYTSDATPPAAAPVQHVKWEDAAQAAHPKSDPQYWPESLKVRFMEKEILQLRATPPAAAQPAPVQIQKSCNVCAHKQRYYLDMTGPCKACRFYSNFASVTPPPAQRKPLTVDCIGLALDLETQSKRVESQTVERAMIAAANGLRIIEAANGIKENT